MGQQSAPEDGPFVQPQREPHQICVQTFYRGALEVSGKRGKSEKKVPKWSNMILSMGHRSFFPGLMLDKIVVGIANNREPGICYTTLSHPDPNSSVISSDFCQLPWNPIESVKMFQCPMTSYGFLWPSMAYSNRFQHPNMEHVLLTPMNSPGPSWTARLTWTPMEFGPWARCTESSRRWVNQHPGWGHTPYPICPWGPVWPSPLPWFFSMVQSIPIILYLFGPHFPGIWWGSIWKDLKSRSPDSQFELPSSTPFFSWVLDTQWRVLVRLRSSFMSRPLRGGRLTTDILMDILMDIMKIYWPSTEWVKRSWWINCFLLLWTNQGDSNSEGSMTFQALALAATEDFPALQRVFNFFGCLWMCSNICSDALII